MIKVAINRQLMQSILSGVADQINSKVDPNTLKKLCKERYGIETIEGFENKNAAIVVIANQVGCKLDFEVRFPMSILITTKEDINVSIPGSNKVRAQIDAISDKADDIPEKLDELELGDLEDMLDKLEDSDPDEIDDLPQNSAFSYFLK